MTVCVSDRKGRSPTAREAHTLRALYLFINGLASSNTGRPRDRGAPWDDGADAGLIPIRPGAFARWMAARDASTAPGEPLLPPAGRGRRAPMPR